MPEICRFLGISITMFHREHGPPHFHAGYGEYRIAVYLETGVVDGRFPRRALRHVLEWYEIHRQELEENWSLSALTSRSKGSSRLSSPVNVYVVEAEYRGGHRVRLRFSDGLQGEADLTNELPGGVFEPLKDESYFAAFMLNDTLTWPNGADFAPETLHHMVTQGKRRRAAASPARSLASTSPGAI